jgi:outer membrane lipopolysaccharide assembly protein LptE/RlpB
MRRRLLVLLLSALLGSISGCGYYLAGGGSSLIKERKIAVSMFANRTFQASLEGKLRLALVSELAGRGSYAETGNNDLVMTGEIESLSIDTAAFSATDKAMLYRASMTVQVQLAEKESGTVLWKSSETLQQEYPAGTDLALQRNARDAALTSLCEKMARALVSGMNQAF